MNGPFETERQARETPAVQAVYAAVRAAPGPGQMQPRNRELIEDACRAAGVTLGAYDARIVSWMAGWEPQVCAVIVGLIYRAARQPGDETAESPSPALPAPVVSGATLAAGAAEAERAHAKHGEYSVAGPAHTPHTRLAVLAEEVGEVAHLLTYDSSGQQADLATS